MPYNPKGFNDIGGDASMAPSELQPPLNFADGGAVSWAGDSTVYNTQSQIGNMLATPGGFSGMSRQFTSPSPMAMAEGGNVSSLMARLKDEFSKRGLDFDRAMAQRLANKGQNGDTMLAHINPDEAQMLKQAGGSGSVNPDTGLSEFYRSGGDSSYSSERDSYSPGTSSESYARESVARDSGGWGGGNNDTRDDRSSREPSNIAIDNSSAQRAAQDRAAAELNAQRAAQEAAAQAAADNAARIAAEKASYEIPSAPSAPSSEMSLSNIMNQIIGITPAEAGNKVIGTGGYLPEVISGGKQFPNQIELNKLRAEEDAAREQQESFNKAKAQADLVEQSLLFPITGFEKPFGQTTKFNKDQSGIVPAGVWTGPELPDINQAAEAARVAAAQPADTFWTDLQRVNDKLAAIRGMNTSASMIGADQNVATEAAKPSPLEAYSQATRPSGVFSPFESAVKAAISSAAPTESPYNYTPTFTPPPVSKVNMSDYSQTSNTTPVTAQPDTEQPSAGTVKKVAEVSEAPVLAAAKKAAATTPAATSVATPAVQKGVLDQIMSGIDAANAKRIAELEQANKFAGGNKAQVASALGVDPSELKSRIVTQDGQQKVDYYTKGLDQVLAEMIAGPSKAIGDLFAPNVNNLPRGSYVRDPRFMDMFSQNVPSKGYGPYGDLTAEEYRQQYGGGNIQMPVAAPAQVAAAVPAVTPVAAAPTTPLTTFNRKYIPLTNYAQYGYGPEATFYNYAAAEGGPVGPLSQKRK